MWNAVFTTVLFTAAAGITLWLAGAIYYDVGHGSRWSGLLAFVWVACVAVLFFAWPPLWEPFVFLLILFAGFLTWWFRIKPKNDRDWEPAVAVLPRAVVSGDAVTIENVRNFEYRSSADFTPHYDTRTYRLECLQGIDVIFFNWGSAVMSHPLLIFDFGPEGRICMSIEVRYRRAQPYSIVASLYRQYELVFVAADERDAILRRTKYGPSQDAYLYRLVTTPDERRATFLDYVNAINNLRGSPRWYHGLCTNCTTSFYQLPSSRRRWDWRVLLNARLDRALYATGRLDRSVPFADLRRAAYLTDVANAAPADGFGDHVRKELETRRAGR